MLKVGGEENKADLEKALSKMHCTYVTKAEESKAESAIQRRWTKEENKMFVEGVRRFGTDWKKVSGHVPAFGGRLSHQSRGASLCGEIRDDDGCWSGDRSGFHVWVIPGEAGAVGYGYDEGE